MSTDVEANYTEAKADQVAALILDALHDQDARTYHGDSGDKGALALRTGKRVEEIVRRDERRRLADLLDENFETIGGTCKTPTAAVKLVALLLRMDHTT